MSKPISMPHLYLRCEWCKSLFLWRPASVWHIEYQRRVTCSQICGGKLKMWNHEREFRPPLTPSAGG